MNLFADAIAWIFSADRLTDFAPLPLLIGQHLAYTLAAIAIAGVIAIPLGWFIGHTGRARSVAVALSGAARALPSFGLILLLVLVMGVSHKSLASLLAYVLLAIPSMLAGAYAGLDAIDRSVVSAARAVGMTEWQVLFKVEVPLGLPLLLGGVRAATLQVVSTVTLAAYVGLGSLGLPIIQGLALRKFDQMLGAALIIVAIAVALDGSIAFAQRIAQRKSNQGAPALSSRASLIDSGAVEGSTTT